MGQGKQVESPLVAVIIPVYKVEKYLESCVQSVVRQDYLPINIYLVDDGSPDRSPELCDKLAAQNWRIRALHKKNGGLSSARNAGLSMVSKDAEYILFLDSDDSLVPGAIAGLVKMAKDSGADIIMPDRYIRKQEDTGAEDIARLFPKSCYICDPKRFAMDVMMEQGRAWRATAVLYTHDVIRQSSAQFPVGYTSEDAIFNFEVMRFANKICFYPNPTLVNLKRTGSITDTFQKGFDQTINYIDQRAREFLQYIGQTGEVAYDKADALLCRNIVVYLISIMSAKELPMPERKSLASELLNNRELSKDVLKKKFTPPYFNSRVARIVMPIICTLLRHNQFKMTIQILSFVFK